MKQNGFGLLEIILVIAVIGLLTYGGYSWWHKGVKVDVSNEQQVENNINKINQNPIQLHQIKVKAADDLNKINQRLKEEASSTENY